LPFASPSEDPQGSDLLTIYFELPDSFDEVTQFVREITKLYSLRLVVLGEFKSGLFQLQKVHPEVKAIFLGTRRNDPHGDKLSSFQHTSPGWPEFMRINPILDWRYHSVWAFIRHYKLPYCSLYDRGYTSIGQRHNTVPNPALLLDALPDGTHRFRPAFDLEDETTERAGRGATDAS